VVKRGQKGWTAPYRAPALPPKKIVWKTEDGTEKFELLGQGQQIVIPDSIHPDTREPYIWWGKLRLDEVPPEDLPELPADTIERLDAALAPLGYAKHERCPEEGAATAAPVARDGDATERLKRVRKILEFATNDLVSMPPESGRNAALNNQAFRFAGYVWWCGITEAEVKENLLWACRHNGPLKEDGLAQCEATFSSGWQAGLLKPLRPLIDRYPATVGPNGSIAVLESR
jgi:hypothetical protein